MINGSIKITVIFNVNLGGVQFPYYFPENKSNLLLKN